MTIDASQGLELPPAFVKPRYNGDCFANLPQTIQYLLTGEGQAALSPQILDGLPQRYDTVILFFIDAFGWRFVEQYRDKYPFLQHLISQGRLSQIVAQFPSTTAAHITCIHTGLAAGQSGVYEWQYYEPRLDALISPLLFSFAGTKERDTLKPTGIDPKQLYPSQTIHQALQKQGVASYIFMQQPAARSTYSHVVCAGAEVKSFSTFSEALVNLSALLARQTSPAYFFLYFDEIDAICHKYGPQSAQVEAEIDTFLTMMERLFLRQWQGKLKNKLLMLTADHGQVEVDPQTTIYLNMEPRFARLQHYLRTDQAGEMLPPGGSPRDVFLYVKDAYLAEAQLFLVERLAGKAEVYQTRQLIEAGFFGPHPPSADFLARVGNLVILPYAGESVWWYETDMFEQKFYGHHGGLTPQEMEIPLFLYTD